MIRGRREHWPTPAARVATAFRFLCARAPTACRSGWGRRSVSYGSCSSKPVATRCVWCCMPHTTLDRHVQTVIQGVNIISQQVYCTLMLYSKMYMVCFQYVFIAQEAKHQKARIIIFLGVEDEMNTTRPLRFRREWCRVVSVEEMESPPRLLLGNEVEN